MSFEISDSRLADEERGAHPWLVRYWPPAKGNPFVALVDPEYPHTVLKKCKGDVVKIANLQAHILADLPEPGESEPQ